jgi:hypothetical protein
VVADVVSPSISLALVDTSAGVGEALFSLKAWHPAVRPEYPIVFATSEALFVGCSAGSASEGADGMCLVMWLLCGS